MPQTKPPPMISDRFLKRLAEMTPERRRRAAASFSRPERAAWAARYPQEVPLINDEHAWIALHLADLD